MTDRSAVDLACEQAWSIYLLINAGIDPNDARRALLERFIRRLCEASESDSQDLVVAGLKYLKILDESGDRFSDNHAC
jgi:hypothetical protein